MGMSSLPLLFALVIEPIAEIIIQDPKITGIGKHEYKLHLFADDHLMYFTNIENSVHPHATND